MSVSTAFLAYLLIWWVTLFAVLPFGALRDPSPVPGQDPGAPRKADIARKLAINTLVALVILGAIEVLIRAGVIRWYDWFAPGAGS